MFLIIIIIIIILYIVQKYGIRAYNHKPFCKYELFVFVFYS